MGFLTKSIQKRFSNVFLAIASQKNEYSAKYSIIKNGEIIEQDERNFPMGEKQQISIELKETLLELKEKYKFVYISFLLESFSQHCLFDCKEKRDENIMRVCIEDGWAVQVAKADIDWVYSLFEDVGVDFIYSTYLVLNNFIDDENRKKNILHVLYMENSLSVLIFDNKNLQFGSFFKIPFKEYDLDDEELKPEETQNDIEGIELDTIESEEEEFEGFVDITKIDDLDEEDEILQSAQEDIESTTMEELELYGREVIIFKNLQSSIEEYYKNENCDSAFIEDVIIYNDSNISNDIINMIESDLFLNVEIHSVDVKEEMINMSIEEVNF